MSQGQGGGRPTKYRSQFCKQAKELARLGATDHEIARFFEISDSTFRLWTHLHPKFSAALKLGKAPADRRTERSLYHRANGYSYESEELFLVAEIIETPAPTEKNPAAVVITRSQKVLRVPVVKHVPPSDTALIFWLKNRRKDRWRDYKAVELTGDVRRPIGMTYQQRGPALLQDYYAKIAASAAAADPDPAAAGDLGSDRQEHDGPGGDEELGPR